MPERNYWLVKSEPEVFSFQDLLASPKQTTHWDGVRNYAARNHLRSMKKGDLVFFYHSNAAPAAIVGVAEVARDAYPDASAFESGSPKFDPKSKPDDPTWFMVDLKAVEELPRPISLDEAKKTKGLENMALIRLGRLSVQPVTKSEYDIIRKLALKPAKA
jgi:predicted RNA-binding protein with PUA-like domain